MRNVALRVRHQQERLQAAEDPVRAPVLCQLHGAARDVPAVLLHLALEALEKGERIGGGSGKADEDLPVVDPADLLGIRLHHRVSHGDLAVAGHCHLVAPAHRDDGGAADSTHSGMGMRPPVDLFQFLHAHVRVHLGGGEARVAEQLLHRPDVGAPVQEMRGKGMAERVRGHPLAEVRPGEVFARMNRTPRSVILPPRWLMKSAARSASPRL